MGRGGGEGFDGDSVFMGECVGFMLVVVFLGIGVMLQCYRAQKRHTCERIPSEAVLLGR